ncbi:hypothetical protein CXG81DRAFT_26704 [Caulochytrium protostelioides]|uniref:Uncharacterized protein n=1 Tax=Caulochytrium protostelioides TaxID=1555241 RepID=A0A4P9X622_9FUNG|nr:hypothetical protein CXG81DRAFT_26704 [Caulochytrium protostelioides]|eukprot:RKP00603.1 hypothetical protein CXG81DRAFT_26704 [Caulochytrium protostelioides]
MPYPADSTYSAQGVSPQGLQSHTVDTHAQQSSSHTQSSHTSDITGARGQHHGMPGTAAHHNPLVPTDVGGEQYAQSGGARFDGTIDPVAKQHLGQRYDPDPDVDRSGAGLLAQTHGAPGVHHAHGTQGLTHDHHQAGTNVAGMNAPGAASGAQYGGNTAAPLAGAGVPGVHGMDPQTMGAAGTTGMPPNGGSPFPLQTNDPAGTASLAGHSGYGAPTTTGTTTTDHPGVSSHDAHKGGLRAKLDNLLPGKHHNNATTHATH